MSDVNLVGARTTPSVFRLLQVPAVGNVHHATGVNVLGMQVCALVPRLENHLGRAGW